MYILCRQLNKSSQRRSLLKRFSSRQALYYQNRCLMLLIPYIAILKNTQKNGIWCMIYPHKEENDYKKYLIYIRYIDIVERFKHRNN